MIVWLNGPFGGGKTTLATALHEALPGSLVVDPEEVGFMMRQVVPPPPTGDFQDLPLWRTLTVHLLREVRRLYAVPLIVPMTLVHPDYLAEIMTGLRDEQVVHVFLRLDAEELRRRITAQVMAPDADDDVRIRQWRLAQVDRCLAAVPSLPPDIHVLDSGRNDPSTLVETVLRLVAAAAPDR